MLEAIQLLQVPPHVVVVMKYARFVCVCHVDTCVIEGGREGEK